MHTFNTHLFNISLYLMSQTIALCNAVLLFVAHCTHNALLLYPYLY